MNYRHSYHAGNFADVFKHILLTLLLGHLRKKETPFRVIDTHAGTGFYDLRAPEAEKTGEFRQGIAQFLAGDPLPSLLDDYVAVLKAANPQWPDLRYYPGSPWLSRALLRPGDRLALVELHPADAGTLKRLFSGDKIVGVHQADGFQSLKALLPPIERRGLVLIDPAYEAPDEFVKMTAALTTAIKRWPQGIYALWYPIKDPKLVEGFLAELLNFGLPCLAAELAIAPDGDHLHRCGMAILNPPWQLANSLDLLLPVLAGRLGETGSGTVRRLKI
ncbi:MAG TPA: 23S rRNA (adenine(2030)-N(6))-methyltransferase RlmJ [Rhodospirillaceae bacterium]|nr:23S rRNA (adenine(2030)-N(6))-methyltransferase RlmJ [Rhodospirillaceae bacterium]